jgi:hypothetical protein
MDRRFLRTGEHRRMPREGYVFDVLARHEPLPPRLA